MNSLLYLAMRKYGVNQFSVETLEEVNSDSRESLKDKLNSREIFFVNRLGTYKPDGYNMTVGGFSFADHVMHPVYKVDIEGNVISYYESMADAEIQNHMPFGSIRRSFQYDTHYANGWFWYDANTINLSIGENIGQQKSQLSPVYCFTLDGKFIRKFNSMIEAETITEVNHSHISSACNSKRLSAGGFLWSYSSIAPVYSSRQKTHRKRGVAQYTLEGVHIKTFDSATSAAKELGIQQSLISACCNGRRKSTGGYQWAFVI
nr:MAG TPA: intron associated endonuclease [Bacteriophage sp.]